MGTEELSLAPLWASIETWKIPIFPPINHGSGTWKNSELLPGAWDLEAFRASL